MNRTQKFALNSLVAAVNQVVVMVVGIITPRLMIATYGSEINGLVSSLNQFITYISLVEAGIGGAAVFALYKPLAENKYSNISRIVAAAQKSYTQAGVLFSSGLLCLAVVYGVLCNTDTLTFGVIFSISILLGINSCVDFFLVAGFRVLLTADQKNYIISSTGIIQTVLRAAILVILAYSKVNVVLVYAIAACPCFLKALLIFLYCKRNYRYVDKNAEPDTTALNKRWDVIYQQILGVVQSGAPTVIATVLLDFLQVSVFSVYNMVITGINGILGIFISGLPAGFGELIAKKEYENLKKTTGEFEVAYYWILSVVYGITLVMILPFIQVYTNGLTDIEYYRPSLAFVVVLNGLLYNIKTPQSMLIISAGMYQETRWRVTIQGSLILVCGVLLGMPFGLEGIVIGSCISNLYRTVDLIYFVPKYITHTDPWKSVKRMLRVVFNVSLILLPAFISPIRVAGYISWLLYAVGVGIYALLIVTATSFLFDKSEFISLIERIKRVLLH